MKKIKLLMILSVSLLVLFTGCYATQDDSNSETETSTTEGADIVEVTEDTFASTVLESEGVVLVDFWAPWCGPCVSLAPTLEEVSAEEGITVYKVNTDENQNLAIEYEISAIPAVFVFVDGEHKDTIIGTNSKLTYTSKIEEYTPADSDE